jgi:hypothetical protein
MLLLPEWQAREVWGPSEKQHSFKNRIARDTGVRLLYFAFRGENKTDTFSIQSKRLQLLYVSTW